MTVTEDSCDKKDEITIDIVSDLYTHGDQQVVGYSDIIGTITKEDNNNNEDEIEIAVSESQPHHNDRQFESYPNSDSGGEKCHSVQHNQFLMRILTGKLT